MLCNASKKKDLPRNRSFHRAQTPRHYRMHVVGLFPVDGNELLPEGAQLSLESHTDPPIAMVGYVTSSYRSTTLGRTFALALVERGRERIGETVFAPMPDRLIAATVTEPIFWDKENRRRDS